MSGLFLVLLLVCLLCVVLGKKSGNHFILRAEENMGEDKETNGDANEVDKEHNRRASIFLPIKLLKINTSRFDSLTARRG